jgi:hypothetical protein
MNITQQEDLLFQEWKRHQKNRLMGEISEQKVEDLFCKDGLHHVGKADKSSGAWSILSNSQEIQLWNDSFIRPVFLTKDYNHQGDFEGVDNRFETGLDNRSNRSDKIYFRFYLKYLTLLFGLHHINRDTWEYPTCDEARRLCLKFFQESAPVVRINLKKIAGESRCSDSTLRSYISEDKQFIKRQLEIYNYNLIVCCHGGERVTECEWLNPIMHFIKFDICDGDLQEYKFGNEPIFLYYSKSKRIIVLHEWHMSHSVSCEDYYQAVSQVARFLSLNILDFK